jgi:prolyl-tRNA editing enzyme YbaK/EbsC (Cys-tRNA(Pro) deacylase)
MLIPRAAAEGVSFRKVHHEPTRTSEDSARARSEELRVGGKALLIKVDNSFRLFVLSADRKPDNVAIKQYFGARKTRFATPEELFGTHRSGARIRATLRCTDSALHALHLPVSF